MTIPSLPVAVGAALPRRGHRQLGLLLCSLLAVVVVAPIVHVAHRALEIDQERSCRTRAASCLGTCQRSVLWPADTCGIRSGCRGQRRTAIAPWADPRRVADAEACVAACVADACRDVDVDVDVGWPRAGRFECAWP